MVIVVNKMDLVPDKPHFDLHKMDETNPTVWVSAKTGQGMDRLERILVDEAEQITRHSLDAVDKVTLSARCLQLLDAAMLPLERTLEMCRAEQYPKLDMISYELRTALQPLEEITGEAVDEGILDRVFERFCVGK